MWIFLIVAIAAGYYFYKKSSNKSLYASGDEKVVIYGASFCGWCKKQKEELDADGTIPYKYVECSEEKELCKEKDIKSFPTLFINGVTSTGFQKIDTIKNALNGST